MALEKENNNNIDINNKAFNTDKSKRNSNLIEEHELSFDRERIGSAGKGFGNLVNDNGNQGMLVTLFVDSLVYFIHYTNFWNLLLNLESIADLIASVKDEDIVKLAKITQRHADQVNKSRLSVI